MTVECLGRYPRRICLASRSAREHTRLSEPGRGEPRFAAEPLECGSTAVALGDAGSLLVDGHVLAPLGRLGPAENVLTLKLACLGVVSAH